MPPQPSFCTSTLSMVFFGASIAYGVLFLLSTGGVIWAKFDMANAEKILALYGGVWTVITSAYLTARKTGNGGSNVPTPTP